MSSRRIVIVSGYFNPLHVGHVRLIRAARELGDYVIVIVNNDDQQLLKKGRIISPLSDRLEVVEALALVDQTVASIDVDQTVRQTLRKIRSTYLGGMIFANGGDRRDPDSISEAEVCREIDVELIFGVGGVDKADSSSRINHLIGAEHAGDHIRS